ncbi:MAG: lactate utilization protein C [Chloroflexaceae bacterium]|nr:lactate utilization protein C [Chloroflexaceae bacterium]NJO04208.1 lactate utilization protein C [Chloroflexaceae bacterium]
MSSSAKEAILYRIRTALHDVPPTEQPDDVAITRAYRQQDDRPHAQVVEQFVEMTVDYKAIVHHMSEADLPARIAQSCQDRNLRRLLVPADLPTAWLPAYEGLEIVTDDPSHPFANADLDATDGVLTGCALAIAQTGTIVLNSGPNQGRRAITLIPDYHLCVVYADQVVSIVPEAIAALRSSVVEQGKPLTFISGPSATSDIELNRVEGVHGPRTLEVIVVERDPQG